MIFKPFKGGKRDKSSQAESPNINQKNTKKKKVIVRIAVAILAIILAFGAFFLVKFLIDENKKNADIKIGDTRISKKQIEDVQKQAEEYKKENPYAAIDSQFARDTLIMNAALKHYAKQCDKNLKISERDIYEYSKQSSSEGLSDNDIKADLGNKENITYLTQENAVYKSRLKDCLIQKREIFVTSISYETPYMSSSANNEEANVKYAEAKKILNERFLPLFKDKKSKEEIAKNADVDLIADKNADKFNIKDLESKMVSFAQMMNLDSIEGSSGFQEGTPKHKGELGEVKSLNEIASKLKTGEHSEVLATSAGLFAIVRVEKSNYGRFLDWDDFLNRAKNEFKTENNNSNKANAALTISGRVCYTISHNQSGSSISCQGPGGGAWISKPGFYFNSPAYQGDVGRHMKAMIVRAVDEKSMPMDGVRVTSQTGVSSSSDTTSYVSYNGLYNNTNGGAYIYSGHGYAYALGDCNAGKVMTTKIHAPNGYRYDGGDIVWTMANSNYEGFTNKEVRLRKKEREKRQVRQNYPSNANTSAQADTRVAVKENGSSAQIAQNSSEWRTGTLVAPVGSHVSFKHEVTGNASSNNNQGNVSVNWNTSGQNKPGLATNGGGNLGSRFNGLAVRQGNTTETKNNNWSSNSSFRVSNADVGKIICDNIRGTITQNPKTRVVTYQVYVDNGQEVPNTRREYWENEPAQSRTATSNQSCVYVPYEFELVPCIKAGNANCGGTDIPVEPGTNTPVVPRITGTGTPTPPNSRWIITRWKIPGNFEGNPEAPKERRDNNNGNTCSHYNNEFGGHARECNSGQTGTGSFTGNPPTVINTGDIGVPNDAELGARYCIGLSISPYKMERNESQAAQNAKVGRDWRHSAPICVLVTKKPKMQVWSNGVYSRGGIKTSRSEIGGNSFGSWVEFEAIGGRTITGFRTESSQNTSNLTFRNGIANSTGRNSNATDRGNWGQWGSSNNVNHLIESLKARYPKSDASRNVHVEGNSNLNTNIGGFTNTGTRIYYAKDATITGNIINSEPRSNGGNFAQTIIIANNINISKDVTRVDAWLIASNEINTCPVGKRNVNESNCGKQLTVNGPLIARSLNSWRTAGSTPTDRKAPAEIYNQRADVYLWAYGQSGGVGRIITTYTKELPVRY